MCMISVFLVVKKFLLFILVLLDWKSLKLAKQSFTREGSEMLLEGEISCPVLDPYKNEFMLSVQKGCVQPLGFF